MNLLKLFLILFIPFLCSGQKPAKEWFPTDLISTGKSKPRISRNPQTVETKYGKALHFNGRTDGLFLDQMPLSGLNEFTIEVLFYPESGGHLEQRFFHTGEIVGDRVLLEIRTTKTDWYFDAFIKSGNRKITLIEPKLLHPLNQWYHVAFVVTNGKQETYINAIKELEGQIEIVPLQGGETSIGVRQNEQSWFKGAIYKIRISPEALNAKDFFDY